MKSLLPIAFLLLLQLQCNFGFAFTIRTRIRGDVSTLVRTRSTSLLLAKKRRRRKNDTQSDDLPDFDLNDEEGATQKKNEPIASEPLGEITSAMMGSASKPVRSVDQLIADRSLESSFQFDEPEDSSLPDLAVLAKKQSAVMGRKRSQREVRVAAALERKTEEEGGSNPFAQIPFITDEKGEVSALKVLEAGTWLGIFTLVGWEIYINSPIFERSAPLAPFIYDFLL